VTDISADAVAEAFALERPIGPLVVMRQRGQVIAWRIETGSGPVLVKRFWAEPDLPWRDQLELALEVEQLAVRTEIDTPAPIDPVHPEFGTVARIDGLGFFRAFPFVEHRPLADADDIAEWVGGTLARTHQLRRLEFPPQPNWWYCQHPPVAPQQWRVWLESGEAQGNSWAPALRTHHDLIVSLATQVVETFVASPPHVLSHRDVEPWNVLIPLDDQPPMLIDWDAAGPESAPLEAAYVFTVFARRGHDDPDLEQVQRAHAAYVAAGGQPLGARPRILDRLIGIELAKLASAIGRFFDAPEADDRTRDRLDQLPTTVANIRRWEKVFAQL
jgi:Ser/Thr protein kinase RdoA (MazF antagonist)